ncbi:beta subunit of N-acylethanolamine-hydrolyzing acid amidase-domain-containing protein [Diaporthe sp. PMI_573]|nr:beta subunit of N-acylethanolamine-hydrolyzing acid amidase-domain-containing protein [Diaporthaceae sp. PMI_573]
MDAVPIYTIDLSRPPAQRYTDLVCDFRDKIPHLTELFQDVVTDFGLPLKATTRLARLFLRRLHSNEQTEEIRGISEASGIDMYLLVCLNTLLDLFMGCTSGGARVQMGRAGGGRQSRMLHFRTLDWAMDPLREVVVQLNFVNEPHGPVIARSVTYVGFVGALTAVRPGLSISLNFRPYHNDSHSRVSNLRFQYHRLLVLLGRRPSISSTLRSILLPPSSSNGDRDVDTISSIQRRLPSLPSTAAYLIFSDGDRTLVMEKDRVTAHTSTSSSFIVITNHDASSDNNPAPASQSDNAKLAITGMNELVEESQVRRQCIESRWKRSESAFRRRRKNASHGDLDAEMSVTESQLVKWVEEWPITNECTHYTTIMDPSAGDFVYLKRYLEPLVVSE